MSASRAAPTVLTGGALLALLATPARADVPGGWGGQTEPNQLDPLSALGLFVGAPLLLFALIALAVYLPSMVRGESCPTTRRARRSGSADPARVFRRAARARRRGLEGGWRKWPLVRR